MTTTTIEKKNGEWHVHIYGPTDTNSTRVRASCPVDGKLVYGRFTLYYDTWHLSLDCSAFVDGGYGEYRGHRGPRGGTGRRRRLTKKVWYQWPVGRWFKQVEKNTATQMQQTKQESTSA